MGFTTQRTFFTADCLLTLQCEGGFTYAFSFMAHIIQTYLFKSLTLFLPLKFSTVSPFILSCSCYAWACHVLVTAQSCFPLLLLFKALHHLLSVAFHSYVFTAFPCLQTGKSWVLHGPHLAYIQYAIWLQNHNLAQTVYCYVCMHIPPWSKLDTVVWIQCLCRKHFFGHVSHTCLWRGRAVIAA